MKHGIRQVVLELSLEEQSVTALDAYRRFFENRIQPLLSTALDAISSPTHDQHIEHLEIDLGTINFDSPYTAWQEAVRSAVSRAHTHGDTIQGALPLLRQEKHESQGEISQQKTLLELIYFFLERGRLPWYETRSFTELEQELERRCDLQMPLPPGPFEERLRGVLHESHARTRLLTGLNLRVSSWLMAGFMQIEVQKLLRSLGRPEEPWPMALRFSRHLFNLPYPERALVAVSADNWWQQVGDQGWEKGDAVAPPIFRQLEHFIRVSLEIPDEVSTTEPVSTPQPEVPESAFIDQAIYVDNAGVVLVAVFLPSLFDTLVLLDEHRQFVDRRAAEQGIHLIHFLATGTTQPHESDLALAKVLCGLHVEEALETTVSLTDQAMEECDRMLGAAIRHWRAVGNTSIEALRQTFLQREGKLEQLGSGWHLTVEQRGVDVLVSNLPWALGAIRLPWFDGILRVDWA